MAGRAGLFGGWPVHAARSVHYWFKKFLTAFKVTLSRVLSTWLADAHQQQPTATPMSNLISEEWSEAVKRTVVKRTAVSEHSVSVMLL